MRQVLHIHAGQHKTGTTAIQKYLFDADLGPDYAYFHAGMANSSLVFLQAFKREFARDPQFPKRELVPEAEQKIRDHARHKISTILSGIEQPHTILSAESLSVLRPEECAELAEFLQPFFDEIRVYIYVRPLKSRIESAFQETLKTRYRGLEQRFPYSFKRSIGMFDDAFGQQQVNVSKFSRDEFDNGNVVDHFLRQVGITDLHCELKEENTSLSFPAIQLLYAYRKYYPTKELGDPERIVKLATLAGNPLRFHSDLYRALLRQKEGDMQWLEQRAGFAVEENITAHDDSAIRSENDLVQLSPQSVEWLRQQQGNILTRWRIRGSNTRSIAMGVRSFRSIDTVSRLIKRQARA